METNQSTITPSAELYQLNKTIRFGLSLKEKKPFKNKPLREFYQSHDILKADIMASQKKLEETLKKHSDKQEKEFVGDVRTCIQEITKYINLWKEVYHRKDQITITKEYYKRLARKACFDWFWYKEKKTGEKVKEPTSSVIALSSLNRNDSASKIVTYWNENIKKIDRKKSEFESILEQYEQAIQQEDKAHTKVNLVNFRKMCLLILNLVEDVLKPLNNESLAFNHKSTLTDNASDRKIKDFQSSEQKQQRTDLGKLMEEIRVYFEANGGYVPFGRVTLNKYTAQQKPENVREDIEKRLSALGIIGLIEQLKEPSDEEIVKYFQLKSTDKVSAINSISKGNKPLIERAQYFKYKIIPLNVRYELASYLEKEHKIEQKESLRIFNSIGRSTNIAEVYEKLKDKNDFNFDHFPLKVGFDYAWENLSRYQTNDSANKFPVEKSRKFLKDIFYVEGTDKNFILYAQLFSLKEKLVALEYGSQNKDTTKLKEEIKKIFPELDQSITFIKYKKERKPEEKKIQDYKKYFDDINKWVEAWLNLTEKQRKDYTKLNNNHQKSDEKWFKEMYKVYDSYNKAKQKIGLIRGGLKNKGKDGRKENSVYYNLTQEFKTIAMDFGKSFADLREKLNEAYQLNKITHYGTILEDANQDRYLLLKALNRDNSEMHGLENLYPHEPNGELKMYEVKSFTSKTLNKIIKNPGAYEDFDYNLNGEKKISITDLEKLKKSLQESKMSKEQSWKEFKWDFSKCDNYEAIEKEINVKSYILKNEKRMSIATVQKLATEEGYSLLPIVNQDICSEQRKPKNEFTKNWQTIFSQDTAHRLHPEFKVLYRHATPNYPKPDEKRYSRFQMIAHFLYEYIPQDARYKSVKEQIKTFNEKGQQENVVRKFNYEMLKNIKDPYYILGIDRGINQLATLCVLNHQGQIQGGHDIYTRKFCPNKKEFIYTSNGKRNLLDLSNLRAETTPQGNKVLVDLSESPSTQNKPRTENQQTIRLKQLAYIRKLQYQMQINPDGILKFIEDCKIEEIYTPHQTEQEEKRINAINNNIKSLITPYKTGEHYADLPIPQIINILREFKYLKDRNKEDELRAFRELDASEDLKYSIVGNMIGVIAYFLERYDYKVYISIEDLSNAFFLAKDGLTNDTISNKEDFREQENLVLAGLGTYHFFEMQLLKKLFRIQENKQIRHLVPPFRSRENYDKIVKRKDLSVTYPFGIIHFVNPKNTSKKCPVCGAEEGAKRSKDIVRCSKCKFETNMPTSEKELLIKEYNKTSKNIIYIVDADENAAYHIALKTFENLNHPPKKH